MTFFLGKPSDGSVYHQLGELTATLRDVSSDLAEMKASAKERGNQTQFIINRIDAIERTTCAQHRDNTATLKGIIDELAAMREPVSQFISMRRRLSTVIVACTTALGLLWFAAEPVYTFIVNKMLGVKP